VAELGTLCLERSRSIEQVIFSRSDLTEGCSQSFEGELGGLVDVDGNGGDALLKKDKIEGEGSAADCSARALLGDDD